MPLAILVVIDDHEIHLFMLIASGVCVLCVLCVLSVCLVCVLSVLSVCLVCVCVCLVCVCVLDVYTYAKGGLREGQVRQGGVVCSW